MRAEKGLVPKVGVEPTRGCPHRFLSLMLDLLFYVVKY